MRAGYISQRQLVDLEELISGIPRHEERILISEAVNCYYAGAYRAAIIVAWVSAADVLEKRLKEIAINDGVAQKRVQIINEQRQKGRSVERELLRSFGPDQDCLGILNTFEEKNLTSVSEWRNSCAHATGFQPTAEQARMAIRTVVEAVMLKPLERGFGYLNELLLDWIQQGRPLTFEKPDGRHIQHLVRELRSALRPTLFEKCLQVYDGTSLPAVRQVSLTFAEQCLLQANTNEGLNGSLRHLSDFLDRYHFPSLSLLSLVGDLNLVEPGIRFRASNVLRNVISSDIDLADAEILVYGRLISNGLLSASELSVNDPLLYEELIVQENFGVVRNFAKCFSSEVTTVVSELLGNIDHAYVYQDTAKLRYGMLAFDIVYIAGLENLQDGPWYSGFARTVVSLAELEDDVVNERELEDDVVNERDDATFRVMDIPLTALSELKKCRAQRCLRSVSPLPETLLEMIMLEVVKSFEVARIGQIKSIYILWLELIDQWVSLGNDFPAAMKTCFIERASLLGDKALIFGLTVIHRRLSEKGFVDTSTVVGDIIDGSIPF